MKEQQQISHKHDWQYPFKTPHFCYLIKKGDPNISTTVSSVAFLDWLLTKEYKPITFVHSHNSTLMGESSLTFNKYNHMRQSRIARFSHHTFNIP